MTRSRYLLIPAVLLALLPTASVGLAQDKPAELLKTIWLYKLGLNSSWPEGAAADANGAFVVGVLGENPYGDFLDELAKRTIRDKKVVIRHFSSVADYKPCHILIISSDNAPDSRERNVQERLEGILTRVEGAPVLLVSDSPGLARQGSMVNFFIANRQLFLEVNVEAAKRVQIDIKPEFLASSSVRRL